MERIRTNPAHRLHTFFKSLFKHKSIQTQDALSVTFNVSKSDSAGLFRAFGKLLTLVDLVEKCIQLIPGEMMEAHRYCLIPIREGLGTTAMDGSWFNGKPYSFPDLAHLQITAEKLHDVVPEDEIAVEEFDQIRPQLEELRTEIGNAEIDPKFKAALLAVLSRLIDVINDYRWVGADGIKRATAEAFGQCVVERDGFFAAKNAGEPWVEKYWTVVSRLADLAQLATAGQLIGLGGADALDRLLLGPK